MTDKPALPQFAVSRRDPFPVLGAVRLAIATATNGRPRNEDAIGVGLIDRDARDLLPVTQSEMLPRATSVVGTIEAITRR